MTILSPAAAREAVAGLARGERVEQARLSVTLEYHFHDVVQRLWSRYEAQVESIDYGAAVIFTLQVPVDRREELVGALSEASSEADGSRSARPLRRRGDCRSV